MKIKNYLIFSSFAVAIGAVAGFVIWLFFKIMNSGIYFLWEFLPDKIDTPLYTVIVCLIGAAIIGLWRKKTGDYPEDLETVMMKVKKDKKYNYKKLPVISISALLPLLFGASVGPEAGLTGVVAGLGSWISDRFKKATKEIKDLANIGLSATLGVVFNAPMFGLIAPFESDEGTNLPKSSKIIAYFLAILGAMGIFYLLSLIIPSSNGLEHFTNLIITSKEIMFLIPLIIVGIIGTFVYYFSNKCIIKFSKPVKNKYVYSSLIAGLFLGLSGTFLPYTMFSGEQQMAEIMNIFTDIGAGVLILTAIIKLVITNSCILLGLKGGSIFPVIFSGICLGFACSLLFEIDSVFCVIVVTTTLVSGIMNKPVATILLLMLCFPIEGIIIMIIAAILGAVIPVKKILKVGEV